MPDIWARVWHAVTTFHAEQWAVLAAWATFIVAVVASIAALRQVREARRLREEQAQPYVIAYTEHSAASPHLIDLVVRNFGTTLARDVRLTSDPILKRTAGQGKTEDVWVFDKLPVLVPGQEWRTFWDSGLERSNTELPDRYEVVVTCKDSHGKRLAPLTAILDWTPYKGRRWVEVFGIHHAAKSLRGIEKEIKGWRESIHGGLGVYVHDGDARQEARRQELARARERLTELTRRAAPTPAAADQDAPDQPSDD
ncbi:hypothetical protein Cs7R123_47820 [Catellatospora sp. TT07R-123]|uniref:hypothetical protein n=1 Tax=Catellatospora sp. TT07R-123 TaxID=2733863 RepID=UPI001B2A30D1|nr:hypothetical protein [Catellatospora sp. TT07R-123]GHJ47440.1 hypothetical protein Cs7R123_47820 [Catellatospora sp. TT07R-123]